MKPGSFFSTALVLAVSFAASNSAEAQLGRIGGAIKKKAADKAAEAVAGKEKAAPVDSSKAAATPAKGTPAAANAAATAKAPPAPPLVIDSDVLTRFAKSLDVEMSRRSLTIKRSACTKRLESSEEAMDIIRWVGGEQEKIQNSSQSDEKKAQAVQQLVVDMEKRKTDLEVKRCGVEAPEMLIPQHERIAAEAGSFEHSQYAQLKERVLPYCTARAKGSDTPSNAKLVYTPAEMTAMQPRCTALLATLKKLG